MNELEGQYTPTPMQQALGAPLPSEQRTGQLLPRVLSPVDLLALFITSVLFIPTVCIVEATQKAGMSIYRYYVDEGFGLVLNPANRDLLSSNCSGYTPEIRRVFPCPQTSAISIG